jgi:hypothetical protein
VDAAASGLTRGCRASLRRLVSDRRQADERRLSPAKPFGADGWLRTVKSCGSGTSTLVSSLAEAKSARPGADFAVNPKGDGGKKARSPGRARSSCKPIACGALGVLVYLWMTAPVVCFWGVGGCGCIKRPAFPRPLQRAATIIYLARKKFHAARSRSCGCLKNEPVASVPADARHLLDCRHPRKRVIQYAAASRPYR